MKTVVKQLKEDIEFLKKQNKELQFEVQNEKDQRIEMSVVLVDILKTLKEYNITIVRHEEKIEEIVEETQKDDEETQQSLPPTFSLELTQQSLAPTVIDEPTPKQSLPPTIIDEPTPIENVEETKKVELVSTLVDDFDILSDNEELEEEKSPILSLVVNEPEIDMTKPPLPNNLIMSPMTPKNEEVEEQVEEEQVEEEQVEEVVNYKKMKVNELKKMCKERGIKGYSKMKKQELIDLLSN